MAGLIDNGFHGENRRDFLHVATGTLAATALAANARRGNWGGWFCPCHGSHYDQSGRIRKGPAPKNLKVPPYKNSEGSQLTVG